MDPNLFPFLFGDMATGQAPPALSPAPLPPNPYAGPGFSNPGAMDASLAGAPYQPPGQTAASVGGNVANAPTPLPPPRPVGAPSPSAMAQGPGGPGLGQTLGAALQGVKAMQSPVQQVRTPPPPQTRAPNIAAMINLLSSLGIGPQQVAGALGRR